MELIEEVTLQTPHCCNIENVDEAEQVDYSKESSYSRILHHTNPKTPSSSSLTPKMRENRGLAAVKLQKVYKSFRIRRQLADCAVLAEQKWHVFLLIFLYIFKW